MVMILQPCLYILLTIALPTVETLEMKGGIVVESFSSSPVLFNNSIRNLVSVKIRQEAVISYKFHVNMKLTQNPPHNLNLTLKILAGNHFINDDCQMYFLATNSTEEELDCVKQNDSVLLGDLQTLRSWNDSSLNITGKYSIVTERTSPGPIRTFIQVEVFEHEYKPVDTWSIFSEPVIQDWPGFGISPPTPDILHMKNKTEVTISVTNLSRSIEDSYLKMYMPTSCENCEEFEAQMSVVRVDLLSPTDIAGKLFYQSETRTSENDAAIYLFDENNRESKPEVLQFSAFSELLDYRNFKNGDILEQAFGYKFKDEFIWIGKTNINVLDDEYRNIPNIETTLYEFSIYEKFGEVSKKFRLNIDHSVNSTGSAYDVMAILYFPPDVDYVRYSHYLQNIVKTPETTVDVDKKNVIFNIPRMSFVHSSKIYFNVSYAAVNGSTSESLSILYEVVYRGWNDTEDRSSLLQVLTIAEGDHEKDKPLHCSCPWNRKQKCVCCKAGWCLCTQSKNPDLCGPCRRPCSCVSDIKEYRKLSRLTYGNVTITCGDFDDLNKYQRSRAIGCQSLTSPGQKVYDLPPVVSTILGVDAVTSYLYGLGNNGRGYVRSEDWGYSWVSIPPYVFHTVTTRQAYKQALFI